MTTYGLSEFMRMLPGLAERTNQVVVATYNYVTGHEEGVTTLISGKPLRLMFGGGEYRHEAFVHGLSAPIPDAEETVRRGATKVHNKMQAPMTEALVILYAGLTQFPSMLSLARRLAEGGNTVVVFGCGCRDNNHRIRSLPELKNVLAVIPSGNHRGCDGGCGELAEVVDFLVAYQG